MIQVFIFENDPLDYKSAALDRVVKVDGSSERIVYGSKSPVCWHPVWNNFPPQSFDGQPVIATRKLISNEKGGETAQAKFDQALLACREASGMCLMFFDMHLGEVVLNASHFEIKLTQKEGESKTDFVGRKNSFSGNLKTLLELVTNATVIENQIEFFHKTKWIGVGMFLMLNALANPEIDGDFIAATQKWPTDAIELLKEAGHRAFQENSLSKVGPGNEHTANGRLKKWVNDFCQARQITLEKLLWPQDSSKWFFSDAESNREKFPIPHSFSVFGQWYSSDKEKCESQIGEYLRRILIYGYRHWNLSDTSTLDQWYKVLDDGVKNQVDCAVAKLLNQKWFYEKCLKTFVGSGAGLLTGNGDKPFVCCFLMPLLAATGPAMWINSLNHSDSRCKFAIEDKTDFTRDDLIATRKIITNSYEFFKQLVRSQNSQNEISVSIDNAANCDFFSVHVGFPATIKVSVNGNKAPLLSLTQFLANETHPSGSTMSKYVAFQKSCIPKGSLKDRSVYSWVLPGTTYGFTEIRIGGVERG